MTPASPLQPSYHYGVYGRILIDSRLLLVRKTRGPYAGLLDAPGGSPEPDESREATLIRELREELNAEIGRMATWASEDLLVMRSTSGAEIPFHHRADWTDVSLVSPPSMDVRSADTAGVEWFDVETGDLELLSPLARIFLP